MPQELLQELKQELEHLSKRDTLYDYKKELLQEEIAALKTINRKR